MKHVVDGLQLYRKALVAFTELNVTGRAALLAETVLLMRNYTAHDHRW